MCCEKVGADGVLVVSTLSQLLADPVCVSGLGVGVGGGDIVIS